MRLRFQSQAGLNICDTPFQTRSHYSREEQKAISDDKPLRVYAPPP
ncbi:MAG: hypothetical protein NHB32_09765 [Fischerella sp. CENA71]|nr:hypothetical protein [Fischerella sp. CENA71]